MTPAWSVAVLILFKALIQFSDSPFDGGAP
jgi:hypothetical protein